MKELGEYLRDTRLQNGVSIEEAAEDNELSSSQLENIENGNLRAFKDVYKLKEYVKNYAKYLGLDPNVVVEEFNDFLFEHTSKISLDDILEAKRQLDIEKEEKKVKSPYTKEYKEHFHYRRLFVVIGIVAAVVIVIFLILSLFNKESTDSRVLTGSSEEVIYEFAN